MEQRLQNVLIPKDFVRFGVKLNDTWRRDYGSLNTLFGIRFENVSAIIEFEAIGAEDGSIIGKFYFSAVSGSNEVSQSKEVVTVENFNEDLVFEIGKDSDEIYLIQVKEPLSSRIGFTIFAGEPLRYIAPDFKRRPLWDVKIELL